MGRCSSALATCFTVSHASFPAASASEWPWPVPWCVSRQFSCWMSRSNLDAQLRASARDELQQFQRRIGTTTIYVTHDQVEAMGLGDRIAVMKAGTVRQIGTPQEIYHEPADTRGPLRRIAADESSAAAKLCPGVSS